MALAEVKAKADAMHEAFRRHEGKAVLVFAERREVPLRPEQGLAANWPAEMPTTAPAFSGVAQPGEFFVFQLGVYALKDTGPLAVSSQPLTGANSTIPAKDLRCLGLGGTNYLGQPFNKEVALKRGHERGVKLRVYYTTREITQNMPELLPLHAFNGEIILPGPGRDARTVLHPQGPHAWLVEMSGLPFGLMSEMLEGANPWRGMVFGETARLPWSGDPRGMWKVWDDFGIQGTEMLPFFLTDCPVQSDHTNVLATVYRKPGRSFVALGSWARDEVQVNLHINWPALGFDPARARLYAPPIPNMQTERRWKPGEPISVAPGRGWFLVLDEVADQAKPEDPRHP
jgi:hypothetical protein